MIIRHNCAVIYLKSIGYEKNFDPDDRLYDRYRTFALGIYLPPAGKKQRPLLLSCRKGDTWILREGQGG